MNPTYNAHPPIGVEGEGTTLPQGGGLARGEGEGGTLKSVHPWGPRGRDPGPGHHSSNRGTWTRPPYSKLNLIPAHFSSATSSGPGSGA